MFNFIVYCLLFIIEQDRYSKHTETSVETDDTDESDFITSFSPTKDSFFRQQLQVCPI